MTGRRIVVLLNAYVSGITGGDTWVLEVLKRLPGEWDVTVVTSQRGVDLCEEYGLGDVEYVVTTGEAEPENIVLLYLVRTLRGVLAARRVNRERSDQFAFASSTFLPDTVPMLFLGGTKAAIYHMKSPNPLFDYRWNLHEEADRLYYLRRSLNWLNEKASMTLVRLGNVTVFALETTDDDVKRYRVAEEDIHITANGVDPESIRDVDANGTRYDACWVGRPSPQKGVEDLLSVWERVTETRGDAQLAIVGSDKEEHEARVERRSLDENVDVTGFVSEEEKYRIMKESEVLIFPSYYESFGIVILEALACNLIVVAYDLPEYDAVYGDRIVTVPLGDEERMAEAVLTTLEEETREPASDIVRRYSWETIAREFERDVRDIMNW